MIVRTKLAEQAEQFEIDGVFYVGRRVLVNEPGGQWWPVGIDLPGKTFMDKWEYRILFRLDYDRGDVFVDPAILRPYQRPERKEEAGT